MAMTESAMPLVYVGTYTRTGPTKAGQAQGIYVYRMDPSSGALTLASKIPKVVNPSYVVLHPSQPDLYAVNEIREMDRKPGGGVSAFAIDPETGALRYLNRQSSHGTHPCHLSVDRTGRYLFVANYTSGSVAMYPLTDDGQIEPASDVVQHAGSSVDPERQTGPHAHSINVDPSNRYALVADLGLDQILVYRLDLERGKLVPNDPPAVATAPGAGPRHLDFHPNGRFVYAVNEMASSITAYAYDAAKGTLRALQTLSMLPEGYAGPNSCADVHVHPSGSFVYGSNRGHDSIASFAIDPRTGLLTRLGWESTQGQTPRGFGIDPTGALLLAANQDSSTIVAFHVDAVSGRLTPTGSISAVPTPVCVKFAGAVH
jgi:6-phosphogluconolactonase